MIEMKQCIDTFLQNADIPLFERLIEHQVRRRNQELSKRLKVLIRYSHLPH